MALLRILALPKVALAWSIVKQKANHRHTMLGQALALVAAFCLSQPAWAQEASSPDRVGFAIQFTGVSELDETTLRTMMERRAQAIVARAQRRPATDAQDFWVQAKVAKRPDEDGNIGFDLRLVGRYQGRSFRWPELGRRCTFCTDGEFVELFAEAFSALMDRPIPEPTAPPPQVSQPTKAPVEPVALKSTEPDPPKIVVHTPTMAQHVVKQPPTAKSGPFRWWGWMGLGLSVAGTSSIVASLATMPRNVPVADNPAQMYPARPDAATKIGLAVGGTCLLAGVTLWVTDLVSGAQKKKPRGRPIAGALWYF